MNVPSRVELSILNVSSIRFSLDWSRPAQTVRKQALLLASAFVASLRALCDALRVVQRTMAAGCRLNKRKKVPSTFQLLLALTEEF